MKPGPARAAVADAINYGDGHFEGSYTSVTGGKNMIIKAHHKGITGPDGKFLGAVGVFEDITERKRAEEEVERRNRELALLNRVIVR